MEISEPGGRGRWSPQRCRPPLRIDLSEVWRLESVRHHEPSDLSLNTLTKSKGRIPDAFLKGCGLQDWEILSAKLYDPDLGDDEIGRLSKELGDLRSGGSVFTPKIFISYSHADTAFVEAIAERLDAKGIRYWHDKDHATSGRPERVIDRAMELNPTVLLVLSKNSVESDWVEWEARKARQLEKKLGRDVLCPVRLDDACFTCAWPERLQVQIEDYNILDFSAWKDEEVIDERFDRLVEGLGIFYRSSS